MPNIKLFQSKQIRSAWNEELQKWYFSVQDVVEALTDSADVKQYIKRMRTAMKNFHPTGVQFVPPFR
jgi:hypothetical protein